MSELDVTKAPFKLLDKHGREETFDEAIATISAGYMNGDRPVVSRDGTIYLHDKQGRAPRLKETLEARRYRSLTIAFMYNDLGDIIKQRYAAYSRGSCLWSGDTKSFTVFGSEVKTYHAGTDEYRKIITHKDTKLHYSIFFALAEWAPTGAEIVLGDGFGNYRIRTTSFNSVRNLVNEYNRLREIWRGPFKGIPFELTLTNRQGNGPDGKKRTYPVWSFTLKPRGGELRLTSGNFRPLVLSGNKAAEGLSLPAPRDLTPDDDVSDAVFADVDAGGVPVDAQQNPTNPVVTHNEETAIDNEAFESARREVEVHDPEADEIADAEFSDVDPTPEQLRALEHNKDPAAMKRLWFATVKDSHLDSDEARSEFLARHVDGVTSLSEVVGLLTPANFDEIILWAAAEITEAKKEDEAQAKLENPNGWHLSVSAKLARTFVQMVRHTGLSRVEIYAFISMVIGRHVFDRAQVDDQDIMTVLDATGVLDDDGNWSYDEPKAADLLMKFDEWQIGEGAKGVL